MTNKRPVEEEKYDVYEHGHSGWGAFAGMDAYPPVVGEKDTFTFSYDGEEDEPPPEFVPVREPTTASERQQYATSIALTKTDNHGFVKMEKGITDLPPS